MKDVMDRAAAAGEDLERVLSHLAYPEPYRADAERMLRHGNSVEGAVRQLTHPQGAYAALRRDELLCYRDPTRWTVS